MEDDDGEARDGALLQLGFYRGDGVGDPRADVGVAGLVDGRVVEARAEEGGWWVEGAEVEDGVDVGGEEVREGGEGGVVGRGHGGGRKVDGGDGGQVDGRRWYGKASGKRREVKELRAAQGRGDAVTEERERTRVAAAGCVERESASWFVVCRGERRDCRIEVDRASTTR